MKWAILKPKFTSSFLPLSLLVILIVGSGTAVSRPAKAVSLRAAAWQQLVEQASEEGSVRVLVQLDLPFRAEGELETAEAVQAQQAGIEFLQDSVLTLLDQTETTVLAAFKYIPYLALEVDAAGLETLSAMPQVVAIEEDIPVPPALTSSIPVIGADAAWNAGFTGVGKTIAILDTGVDTGHPAFTTGGSRIVSEGCYSTTHAGYGATTVCPGGVESSTASGSGVDCTAVVGPANSKAQSDCSHGTHVASIAAGNNGSDIVGVAPGANIIAIQIFSLFNNPGYCRGFSSCALTFTSDQILALERVYELRKSFDISSINMSLGGGQYFSPCDSDSRKAAIDNLRAAGIATIIASGNDGYRDSMGAPACISSAISVGATDDVDNVAYFSNIAPFIDLVAPGVGIYAAVPDGAGTKQGTSMATPHVAGAWALMSQAVPGISVDDALAAIQAGAALVDDDRSSGFVTDLARIHVQNAINAYVTGLTVEVSADSDYFLPGDPVFFTVNITNDTGQAAAQVTITAPIPDDFLVDAGSLSGDAAVANNLISWITGESLNPGQSLTRTVAMAVEHSALPGIRQFSATGDSPDLDEARQGTAVVNITDLVSCGFSEGFETGTLSSAWETAVTEEGRVRILTDLPNSGSYSLILDDGVAGAAKSEAAVVLTADLTGQAEVDLAFSWYDLGDEYDALFDGVFIREQPGEAWTKVYDFAGSNHDAYQDGQLDLELAAANNGLSLTDRFQVKFGFSDNFPFNPGSLTGGDGYALDDISLTCVPSGLVATPLVDNQNPQPGDALNFEIVVTNNETVTATNAIINFIMAAGLEVVGPVVVDGASEAPEGISSDPPLLVSGLTIGPGQEITVVVPTLVASNLSPGTILENVVMLSSNEFGSPPPVSKTLTVSAGSYAQFIPLVIR